MAFPTIVGLGTFYESQGAGQPNMPAHQAGDDLFLVVISGMTDVISFTANPDGFALMPDSGGGTGGSGGTNGECRLSVYHLKATSGAMVAPTLFDPANHIGAQIMVARGCKTGQPWNFSPINVPLTGTPSTAISLPGGETTKNECLVVQILGHGRDNAAPLVSGLTNAGLASLTEQTDVSTILGHGGGFAIVTGQKAVAGAFGATTGTLGGGASLQERYTFALEPPPVVTAWQMNPATLCRLAPQISWGPLGGGAVPASRKKRKRIAAVLGGNLV